MKRILVGLVLIFGLTLPALEISEIEFENNADFTDQDLAAEIISYPGMEYNQKTILEDGRRLAEFYKRQGYYLAKVHLPESIPQSNDQIQVVFFIEEGNKLPVKNITLVGNQYIKSNTIKSNLKTNLQFLSDTKAYCEEIIDYYNQQSFYFAQAEVDSIEIVADEFINLNIKITEGDYCRFNRHVMRGNEVTRKETILRLSQLAEKQDISPDMLKQAAQKLESRAYIENCIILPADKNTLVYEIEEGAMTAFSGIIGYDNDQEEDNRFTGFIDVNFENLWGTDRSVGFFWENRVDQHTAVELNYHESGWKYPIAGDISLYREEKDSTWIEVSYDLKLYWYDLFNELGVYFKRENIYAGARRPIIIDETRFYKTGVFWNYSDLSHPLNPRSGVDQSVKYYYIFSRSGGKDTGRQAAELMYHKLIPLVSRWVFSAEFNLNVIENKNLTEFDVFNAGGAGSIRGFLEKQFSGYRVGWTNLEMRYLLSRDSRLSLNADLGQIKSLSSGEQTVYSLGAGLRTATPIGQLSLDIALPGNEAGFEELLDSILHFGLETRF